MRTGRIIAIGMVAMSLFTVMGGYPGQVDPILAELSGSGGRNTRPFTAPAAWEIQWNAQGQVFQIYVYSEVGELVGVAANQLGAGKGTSYQPRGGRYYLQVNATGSWTIRVVEVK
jgi:hypothetical protein